MQISGVREGSVVGNWCSLTHDKSEQVVASLSRGALSVGAWGLLRENLDMFLSSLRPWKQLHWRALWGENAWGNRRNSRMTSLTLPRDVSVVPSQALRVWPHAMEVTLMQWAHRRLVSY